MSEKLKNVCENCNFKEEFIELLEFLESYYNTIDICNELDMVDWILESAKDLTSLTEKEKFILGTGFLASEIRKY